VLKIFGFNVSIHWVTVAEHMLPAVFSSIVIIIVALLLNMIAKRVIRRAVRHSERFSQAGAGRIRTVQTLLTSVVSYTILFVVIVTVLRKFNVPTSALLTSAGVVGLAIGFGAQGLVSDIVTGFFLLIEGQVAVDDYITVGTYSGIVEEVTLRLLKIRDFNGDLHFIPNRQISSLTNHSRGNMQAMVDISISYDSDINAAMAVLQKKCDEIKELSPDIIEGPNVVGVQNLGTSDVTIRIIAKTANMQQWTVERALRKALKEALDEAGIEIPYPHTTVIHKNVEHNS